MSNQNLKNLYESDSYAWYFKNAELLKNRQFNELDIENLVEELESMGKWERNKLKNILIQLFLHLLKWKFQPSLQSRSWKVSIRNQRLEIKEHLDENPSLSGHFDTIAKDAYRSARREAEQETGLEIETFPEEMLFTLKEALKDGWLPN